MNFIWAGFSLLSFAVTVLAIIRERGEDSAYKENKLGYRS